MRSKLLSLLVIVPVLFALIGAAPAAAAEGKKKEEEAKAEEKAPPAAGKEDEEKKKPKEKPFEEVIDGFDKVEGLFTFWRNDKEGKAYLEIKPEQFDTIYLAR